MGESSDPNTRQGSKGNDARADAVGERLPVSLSHPARILVVVGGQLAFGERNGPGVRHQRAMLVFDGDDTLWETEPLYDLARSEAAKVVADAGLDPAQFEALQRDIDERNVATMGLSPSRFPTSSAQAFLELAELAGVAVDPTDVSRVYDASAKVFDSRAPLLPHAASVLNSLSTTHRLALLTKGDPSVQECRVRTSGLSELFDVVRVVPHKDSTTFGDLLDELNAAPHTSWSIGNSLPSDVAPALELGMRAIWIDAPVWAHERREHGAQLDSPSLFIARSLADVPRIVSTSSLQPT